MAMQRRHFIKNGLWLSTLPCWHSCLSADNRLPPGSVRSGAATGHLIREPFPEGVPVTMKKKMVIIGGGITGLSAARELLRQGEQDFILLEMAPQAGGNSSSGSNRLTVYPLGAHYLPIPDPAMTDLTEFLQEAGIIQSIDPVTQIPVYQEAYLCFAPQERLFIQGYWQDGLVPDLGLSTKDREEVRRFLNRMQVFKKSSGIDGKPAFAIPLENSSTDPSFRILDQISFREWMQQEQFNCQPLQWYVDYCCLDDFGALANSVSAWAGIHYFASRRGKAANAPDHAVLTWPEGNHFLVQQLEKPLHPYIQTQTLVRKIERNADSVQLTCYDVQQQHYYRIEATKVLVATPLHTHPYLLPELTERNTRIRSSCTSYPWVVANLLVKAGDERSGQPESWDNVIYGGRTLGYVHATHQSLLQQGAYRQMTVYLPLATKSAAEERKAAFSQSYKNWLELILQDLKRAHPDLAERIEYADIWLWGHGMIAPTVNYLFSGIREQLAASVGQQVYFAHSDLAGMSIFEEAFYQGLHAARKMMHS